MTTTATSSTTSRIDGIHTIGVPVTDQDRALEFYSGRLGFDVRVDAPMPQLGGRWIEVAPPGGGISVALVPASDHAPAGREVGIRFTTRDAADLHRALTSAGVTVGDLLAWPGVPPMFTFRDPDGNGFEIIQHD
jgi:catechol 2,3-dioxygenase-like lactoylglutathione lyase family enzyme